MLLYSEVFRLSRVARFRIVPYISFNYHGQTTVSGAFLNLNIARSSNLDDFASVNLNFLVFSQSIINMTNTSGLTKLNTRFSIEN
jgi:hypothetical protein